MKHLGDITKINGGEVPAVDVIIGGSPCQDLSVAGKRKGLSGERSGLFMEQIRIVKEMRERDARAGRTGSFIRPRYMVWENVPGAFSSSGGEDFRAVLEEIVRVKGEGTVIPRPPDGKWRTAGLILGDGYSVAWRVLDARFWGVPQRRRRIALVADFGGISAGEILFNGGSLQGDSAESGETGEGAAAGAKRSTGKAGSAVAFNYKASPGSGNVPVTYCIQENCIDRSDTAGCNGKGWKTDESYTLNTIDRPAVYDGRGSGDGKVPVAYCIAGNFVDRECTMNGSGVKKDASFTLNTVDRPAVAFSFDSLASNSMKSKNPNSGCREVDESRTLDAQIPDPSRNQGGICIVQSAVYDARGNGDGKVVPTITGDHESRINDYAAIVMATGQANAEIQENIFPTLSCNHEAPILAGTLTPWGSQANRVYSDNGEYPSLSAREKSGMNRKSVLHENFVRRLTPLECERLQGYPDGWTDIGDWVDSKGKKRQCSDAARYRALGNSIALPPWKWVLKRICAQYERDATMGSLFDGIGGFPYIWEQLNGKGSCLWASEIEEFLIAVTKRRINGEA